VQVYSGGLILCVVCNGVVVEDLLKSLVSVNVCLDRDEIFGTFRFCEVWVSFKYFFKYIILNLVLPGLKVFLIHNFHFIKFLWSNFTHILPRERMNIFMPVKFLVMIIVIWLHAFKPIQI
jgi:hypothetical protein